MDWLDDAKKRREAVKAANRCIHLARVINDRYKNAARMPPAEVENCALLFAEASRIRGLLAGWGA